MPAGEGGATGRPPQHSDELASAMRTVPEYAGGGASARRRAPSRPGEGGHALRIAPLPSREGASAHRVPPHPPGEGAPALRTAPLLSREGAPAPRVAPLPSGEVARAPRVAPPPSDEGASAPYAAATTSAEATPSNASTLGADLPPSAGGAPLDDTREAPEPELDDAQKLAQQIAAMSTAQKMQMAMHGDRTARLLLLKDVNKNIQTFIIQNPRITLEEVRYIAGFRQANPDVLNTIAANRDWTNNPNIVSSLVRNPKTPGATAVKLLDKLPIGEIRRLAKSNDVPRAVNQAARKKVADGL